MCVYCLHMDGLKINKRKLYGKGLPNNNSFLQHYLFLKEYLHKLRKFKTGETNFFNKMASFFKVSTLKVEIKLLC